MFGHVGSLLIATHSDDGGRSIGLHVTHVQVNSTELIEMPEQIRKLACSIAELSQMSGVGRSFLYEEIKARRLIVTKAGRRSIVLYNDALAWLTTLPKLSPSSMSRQGREI
jgi:hypothetical protein